MPNAGALGEPLEAMLSGVPTITGLPELEELLYVGVFVGRLAELLGRVPTIPETAELDALLYVGLLEGMLP